MVDDGDDDDDDEAETWIGVAMEAEKVVLNWVYKGKERIGKCPESP